MPDFWTQCGFALAGHSADGKLTVTDALLRSWWLRPEMAPVAESCAHERAIHAALLDSPNRAVSRAELTDMRDPDAREAYRIMLAFRDRIFAAPTIEAAYRNLFGHGNVTVPPSLVNTLVQLILRNMLRDTRDPLELRAAELFFRPQRVSLDGGAILLADAETVAQHESGSAYGALGRMLVENNIRTKGFALDVLDADNAPLYWERDSTYDTALNFSHGTAGMSATCRVLEKWVKHFHGATVQVQPLQTTATGDWSWHLGLDAEGTAMLNDLHHGIALPPDRQRRLLSFFRMDFAEPRTLRAELAGQAIHMACAMDTVSVLRLKPQNLLTNLPLQVAS